MHAIVLSTNHRNVDNWLPLFQRLVQQGDHIEGLWLPWSGDASVERMAGLPLPVRMARSISRLDQEGLSLEELRALLDRAITPEVDVVFLCDMQSYPSSAVHGLLKARGRSPKVIGLQHGLFQSWWLYNQSFCADELLCFGPRHVRELTPSLRSRAHPVGLPKLDALLDLSTAKGGYILYLAQRVPEAEHVAPLLAELEAATGLRVLVRDHPQYPGLLGSRLMPGAPEAAPDPMSEAPYYQQLANANWVLTPHSTGGIEALHLGKPLVLLPNHGLTAWAGYPGVATDLSVGAVLAALDRAQPGCTEVDLFLVDAFGGLRFDSATRAADAVARLLGRGAPVAAVSIPASSSVAGEGLESVAWLFQCDNRNRGILRQNFDEAALLWQAVRGSGGPILEVGRRHGGSTVLLLAASGDRPVVSIDIAPAHNPAAESYFEQVAVSQPGRLRLEAGDSRQPLALGTQFGLLFVDGDHTYEGVRADTVAHWPALRAHGGCPPLAVFHDAVPNPGLAYDDRPNHCEGVERFCRELLEAGSAVVVKAAGSSLLLRKTAELPAAWVFDVRRTMLVRRDDVISLVRPGGVGIELGVAEGVLSERFLNRGVLSHLYSVDMYSGDRGHDVEQYKRALRRLAPFRDRNTVIKMRFDEALDLFADSTFDFIYVDGYAHTGEEAGQTFHDWYPKLKPGGVMAGDDYCSEWPLVVQAVDRFLSDKALTLHVIDCREDAAYCKYPTWYTRKPD